ncbi:MAG: glycosyltransferase family 4 protein [Candidatus Omnitrophota bacterium]|nr:glycosyltransferase family 4 protein [Candidatus Omnitrophota bacterium]
MKILILTDLLPLDLAGGAGTYVYSLSLGLIKRGHKITVITRHFDNLAQEEKIEGMDIFRISWGRALPIFRPWVFFLGIQNVLKKVEGNHLYDLVIFNQPFSAFCVSFSRGINSVRKIYNFHSSWVDEFAIKKGLVTVNGYSLLTGIKKICFQPLLFIMAIMEKSVLKISHKVIVLSQFSRDRVIELHKISPDKIKVIPYAVDCDKFYPAPDKNNLRRRLKLPEDKFILLTVRNLVPRMGIDNLILAFEEIVSRHPEAYLIVAGSGFMEDKLKNLAQKLKLADKINFVGTLRNEELHNYYQSADLFILPTKYLEGFGIVTLEAMASGLPVLGTPVGGTVEILAKFDKNFLFEGTGQQSMAKKILEFLDNKPDMPQLAKCCREFVLREYSQDKWLDSMEEILIADNGNK